MKNFLAYYFSYTINWMWTLGSILFTILSLNGQIKYEAPIFYFFALASILMLIYNIISEYKSYRKDYKYNRLIVYIFYGLCFLIVLTMCVILFINKTN